MFEAWGRIVYRWRWATLVASLVVLVLSLAAFRAAGSLTSSGQLTGNEEAARAARLQQAELAPAEQKEGAQFTLILRSESQNVSDPAFQNAMEAALAPLRADARVVSVVTPYNAGTPGAATALTSRDGRQALAIVTVKDDLNVARKYYPELRSQVHSDTLKVLATGNLAINRAFDTTLEDDLKRAELVSLPLVLLLLLLVFAAVVAALLPLGVGILAVVGGLSATLLLARFTDVSQYALNVVTLIGLGVAIDYSLFVVNRFREELAAGASREDALARTVATAGRAITFSGVTVAIGLSTMLFFRGTFLASMGAAGALVVALAVLYGLTFLPALLAIMGPGVDRWRLSIPRRRAGQGFWHAMATWVMRRPVLVLAPTVVALLAAGIPFLHLRMANGDVDMLPTRVDARQGYDTLLRDFPGQDQTSFAIVVHYPDGNPLAPARVGDLYDLSRRIARLPNVLRVQGPVDLDPTLGRADYQRLYSGPRDALPMEAREALQRSVGPHIAVLTAYSNRPASSDDARNIVRSIRRDARVPGGEVLVTGLTAFDIDVVKFITDRVPLAVGFVILVTYVILFLLTGSLILPLKAVLVNLLSVAASFGALVWIFQDGHLSRLLGFTPQSLDPSIPVILFSIVFGLSMDYEVLLVSRIHEEYRRRGDNTQAVASGLERSGRLITGAAAIMVAVFLAFGLAEVVIIKAIGLGLAIAVALDATIVRALVVPAVMRLLGTRNWWAPRPLVRLYQRVGLGELPATSQPELVPEMAEV
jgi:RND superfamily putative drug exporter